jgi:CRISPR system Cascade subunit CasD
MTIANTIFIRLEGPLQAWGDTSKFVIRRTMDAPTKSGVLGLICCAMGLSRQQRV